jgi:hypothetical protein
MTGVADHDQVSRDLARAPLGRRVCRARQCPELDNVEDLMTQISTANTSSEMVRSAPTTALRVAFRELELYDTGDVAGADEVFSPDLIDHTPVADTGSAIEGPTEANSSESRPLATRFRVRALNFYQFADGQIVREQGQPDLLGLLQQIGAAPAF